MKIPAPARQNCAGPGAGIEPLGSEISGDDDDRPNRDRDGDPSDDDGPMSNKNSWTMQNPQGPPPGEDVG